MTPPGLVISAPASGTGKTLLMLGLLAAFRARGVHVQPFKSGPDYIDPGFHTAASGRASRNLDTWAMSAPLLSNILEGSNDADLILAEGSMGLFDGVLTAGEVSNGSSSSLAAHTGWPVILILDVSGQAQSAAMTALGAAKLQADVKIAGVVLNKVASPRHEALTRKGFETIGIPVLGALPRNPDVVLPERHLGLVQAEENSRLFDLIDAAGQFVGTHVDLDALRALAAQNVTFDGSNVQITPPGQRIALARDAAFSFVYPHLIQGWRKAGAEILPFSPLADMAPDDTADCCWLPGGYPELHAAALSGAHQFRNGLRQFAQTRPVHGECGGYMAMGQTLTDKSGEVHQMAGLLGLETSFAKRKFHLGYRKAKLKSGIPGFAPGRILRGHEFHYTTILNQPDDALAEVVDANGDPVVETGSRRGLATGTFFHLIAEAT